MAYEIQNITDAGEDEEGIGSIVLPIWADTLLTAFTIGDREYLGLPYRSRRIKPNDSDAKQGGFIASLLYQGIVGNERLESEPIEFDLTGEFSKAPIETFPKLQKLKDLWGGYTDEAGKLQFPEKRPKQAIGTGAGGFALPAGSGTDSDANPLFGVKDWDLYHAVYTRTFSKKKIPGDILKKVGRVYKTPPGLSSGLTPPDRDWLFMLPGIQSKGNAVRIVERYKLSPPGKWPPHIHMLYQGNFQ